MSKKSMIAANLIAQLQQRGFIAQTTDLAGLTQQLAAGPVTLYSGFDPTADSLHIGHLVPLLCLRHFQLAGHRPIILVGGATGLIGDPTFKTAERQLNSAETVHSWTEAVAKQAAPFLEFDNSPNGALLLNNYAWFKSIDLLTFLRDIGKHFSVNAMIHKEAVRQRLERQNSGISFTEFSYNLLQAYDFALLHRDHGAVLQLGGSDQWGNIVSGVDLTRRLWQKTVYGLTLPLITKADGSKFGKTEGGTVWLSAEKTSPYRFYQFWLSTTDADVYRFLALFTFLSLADIATLQTSDAASNQAPQAQSLLAAEVTRLVHGEAALMAAQRITQALFKGDIHQLSASDFAQLAQDGVPSITLSGSVNLAQVLVSAGLSPSQSQARTLITAGAITVNDTQCNDAHYILQASDRRYGRYTLLKRGKKHYSLLCWH